MSPRAATWLAWTLSLATLTLLCAGLVLWPVDGFPLLLGTDEATGGAPIRLLAVLSFELIAVLALIIASRHSKSPIGWILIVAVLVSTLYLISQNLAGRPSHAGPTPCAGSRQSHSPSTSALVL